MNNYYITVCGRDSLKNKMYNFSSSFIPSQKQLQEMLGKRDCSSTPTFSPVMYVKAFDLNYFSCEKQDEHIFLALDLDIFPFEIHGVVYASALINFLHDVLKDIPESDPNIFAIQSSLRILYEIPETSNKYLANCQQCKNRNPVYQCKESNCFHCIECLQKYLLDCYDNDVFEKYL